MAFLISYYSLMTSLSQGETVPSVDDCHWKVCPAPKLAPLKLSVNGVAGQIALTEATVVPAFGGVVHGAPGVYAIWRNGLLSSIVEMEFVVADNVPEAAKVSCPVP